MNNGQWALVLRALKRVGLLKRLNFSAPRTSGCQRQMIPLLAGVGFSHFFEYEPWMRVVLRKLELETSQIFVDIGVNIGQTLLSLRAAYPDQPYLGFEPNPNCVAYTGELARLNGYKNAQIVPVGVSQTTSIASLHCSPDDLVDAGASPLADFRGDEAMEQHICLMNFEAIAPMLENPIGLLKIDVEGGELEVLQTLKPLLADQSPPILLEVLPNYGGESSERLRRQGEIEELLRAHDYLIARVIKNEQREFLKFELVDSFGSHHNIDWCDYLLCPSQSQASRLFS